MYVATFGDWSISRPHTDPFPIRCAMTPRRCTLFSPAVGHLPDPRRVIVRRLLVFFLLLSLASFAQSAPEKPRTKEITIDAIVAPGGLTGRAPETVQWSPDRAQLSLGQRDDPGEHGESASLH